jgi:hypothetical protein
MSAAPEPGPTELQLLKNDSKLPLTIPALAWPGASSVAMTNPTTAAGLERVISNTPLVVIE